MKGKVSWEHRDGGRLELSGGEKMRFISRGGGVQRRSRKRWRETTPVKRG